MDLADIYRAFPPKSKYYTFFSDLMELFSKINHILRHQANLNRYKKIENISYILTDHQRLKIDIHNNRNLTNTEIEQLTTEWKTV